MNNFKQWFLYAIIGLTMTGLSVTIPVVYGQTSSAPNNTEINSTMPISSSLTIKKPTIISILEINPFPNVAKNDHVKVSAKLIEALTLKPMAGQSVELKASFVSATIPPSVEPINVSPVTTGSDGRFTFDVTAPNEQGVITFVANFNGTPSHYGTISNPSFVVVR
jgi:hypothetical protein